ncbi:MAG: YdeI/OmpD-associated family protein [Propioniciclava sp.]
MKFEATIEPFGPAAAVVLTDAQVEELGGGRRAAVIVGVGEVTARLRLSVMGGQNVIGLSKESRATLGVDRGDMVEVEITLDAEPRGVDVPPALAEALAADADATAAFDRLAYTHRKEYARWVAEAKRDETRTRRVAQAMEMIREGKTR